MVLNFDIKPFKIPQFLGVADELKRIHYLGVNNWVAVVAVTGGGIPWSGESLGSLRPVVDFLEKRGIIGAREVLEDRIAGRVIQTVDQWNRFPKDWRFHLTSSGSLTEALKSPELGAQTQEGNFEFKTDGTRRIYTFNFDISIFQFKINEEQASISHTSPWRSFREAGQEFSDKVRIEFEKSDFFQALFKFKREGGKGTRFP
jgi:hypothetical protein